MESRARVPSQPPALHKECLRQNYAIKTAACAAVSGLLTS